MKKILQPLTEKRVYRILRGTQFIGLHAKIIEQYHAIHIKDLLLKDPRANQACKRIAFEVEVIQRSLRKLVKETDTETLDYETAPALARLTELFTTCPPAKIEEICDSIDGTEPQSTKEFVIKFFEGVLEKAMVSNADAIRMVSDKLNELKR